MGVSWRNAGEEWISRNEFPVSKLFNSIWDCFSSITRSLKSFDIFWPLAVELGPFVVSNIERFERNLIANFILTINVVLYIYNCVFIAMIK